jgi:hypothetical protein
MMAILIDRRFLAGALVMFVSGLLMAANLLHAYLVFAVGWWIVLNSIGLALCLDRRRAASLNSRPVVRESASKMPVPLKTSNRPATLYGTEISPADVGRGL